MGNTITLLPHNIPVYAQLRDMLEQERKAMLVSATGTGKSYIVGKYLEEHPQETVVVCPKTSICHAWEKLGFMTMTYHRMYRLDKNELLALPYACWIFDEAHHCGGPSWQKNIDLLMRLRPELVYIGLTADPKRYSDGGRDVSEEIFGGHVVYGTGLEDAIQKDILPSFTYVSTVFGLDEDIRKVKAAAATARTNKELVKETIHRLEYSAKNVFSIREVLEKHMPEGKRKGVVFVDSIENLQEAKDVMREYLGSTGNFLVVHSRLAASENREALDAFYAAKEGWIFAVNMLNEGLHFPGVNTAVMLRHTSSPAVYFQQIGRALAAYNTDVIIFDFVGNRKGLETKGSAIEKAADYGKKLIKSKDEHVIVYDYISDAMDILKQIRELLNGAWSRDEDDIVRRYYPQEGSECVLRLPGRTRGACTARAKKLGVYTDFNRPWTKEEEEIVLEYYLEEGKDIMQKLPGRTWCAVMAKAKASGLNIRHKWTDKELEILKEYYPSEGPECCKRLEGRSRSACVSAASKTGIRSNVRIPWTEEEDTLIREYYPAEGTKLLSRTPGRTKVQLERRAASLGVKYDDGRFTKEEDDILRRYYPQEGINVMLRLPGRTKEQCQRRVKRLKIKLDNGVKAWDEKEISVLMQYYPKEGVSVADRLPGRSRQACNSKAWVLGLTHKESSGIAG
ncbi:MAG: hypothetical protein LUE14_07960 [Clostridiales bacterium]|nr:hypothetical protein [Clostridiales bacterium]